DGLGRIHAEDDQEHGVVLDLAPIDPCCGGDAMLAVDDLTVLGERDRIGEQVAPVAGPHLLLVLPHAAGEDVSVVQGRREQASLPSVRSEARGAVVGHVEPGGTPRRLRTEDGYLLVKDRHDKARRRYLLRDLIIAGAYVHRLLNGQLRLLALAEPPLVPGE